MSVRFWDRVDRSAGEDGCWLWKGSASPGGYGWFWWNGKNRRAHRVAWELTHGPLGDGVRVLHDCDNPPCVNPRHLFLGSDAVNMADKVAKNRQTKGEKVNTSKLVEADVVAIRERYASGETMSDLANEFLITTGQVSKVIRGVDWKHVGGPVGVRRRDLKGILRGEKATGGVLTEAQIKEIRRRCSEGERQASLAREFGVSDTSVSNIVRRRTWRHVP